MHQRILYPNKIKQQNPQININIPWYGWNHILQNISTWSEAQAFKYVILIYNAYSPTCKLINSSPMSCPSRFYPWFNKYLQLLLSCFANTNMTSVTHRNALKKRLNWKVGLRIQRKHSKDKDLVEKYLHGSQKPLKENVVAAMRTGFSKPVLSSTHTAPENENSCSSSRKCLFYVRNVFEMNLRKKKKCICKNSKELWSSECRCCKTKCKNLCTCFFTPTCSFSIISQHIST